MKSTKRSVNMAAVSAWTFCLQWLSIFTYSCMHVQLPSLLTLRLIVISWFVSIGGWVVQTQVTRNVCYCADVSCNMASLCWWLRTWFRLGQILWEPFKYLRNSTRLLLGKICITATQHPHSPRIPDAKLFVGLKCFSQTRTFGQSDMKWKTDAFTSLLL